MRNPAPEPIDPRATQLAAARFYGAKSEPIRSIDVVSSAETAIGAHELWRVSHGSASDLYQVFVDAAGRDVLQAGTPADQAQKPASAGIGIADGDAANRAATAYGHALAAGSPLGLGTLHGTAPLDGPGRVLSGEQSNTSLVFDHAIVKLFRRLEPGLSPDVELLSRITECPFVAPVRGWVTCPNPGGEDFTLAMIQDKVTDAADGWAFAVDAASRGTSFQAEAHSLGNAIASVHHHLAQAFGTEQVATDRLAERLTARAEELAARTPDLREYLPAATACYDTLRGSATAIQRIHGDLHLGQVLRNVRSEEPSYVLIDFEGEPTRPLAERRLPDSPLRDLAGMLRSIDYAAGASALPQAEAADWVQAASEALISGYGTGRSPLLDAYVLDKALYEVDYEVNNRPAWAHIPLAAVRRITAAL